MAKKSIGHFKSPRTKTRIDIYAKKRESDADAIKRVTGKHDADPDDVVLH